MNTGPWRKVSSRSPPSITIEPVMSPGIRSGVNCTRRVCTSSAAASDPHQQRLRDTGHALHQHVPAGEQGHQQAGDRTVLPDDGLRHLGPDTGQCLAGLAR